MRLAPSIPVLVVVACLAGCGSSDPTSFYVLTAPDATPAETADGPAIGVGPVTLPAYLDRSEIVMRTGGTGLALADFDHWAEPLHDNFVRVLAECLSARLATERVHLAPLEDTAVDYRVRVSVLRFDTDTTGAATLTARWTVTAIPTGTSAAREVAMHRSTFTAPADPADMAARVQALADTVAQLGRTIADAIAADRKRSP